MAWLDLSNLFDDFCKHLDGKIGWSQATDREWTDASFTFFSELYSEQEIHAFEQKTDYMRVDYIWRSKAPNEYIELAVEHENTGDMREILANEMRHLIDIKADHKVLITYPSFGDEVTFVEEIKKMIGQHRRPMSHWEDYLVIFGFSVRRESKPAIRFKGYLFNNKGELTEVKDTVIYQAI